MSSVNWPSLGLTEMKHWMWTDAEGDAIGRSQTWVLHLILLSTSLRNFGQITYPLSEHPFFSLPKEPVIQQTLEVDVETR